MSAFKKSENSESTFTHLILKSNLLPCYLFRYIRSLIPTGFPRHFLTFPPPAREFPKSIVTGLTCLFKEEFGSKDRADRLLGFRSEGRTDSHRWNRVSLDESGNHGRGGRGEEQRRRRMRKGGWRGSERWSWRWRGGLELLCERGSEEVGERGGQGLERLNAAFGRATQSIHSEAVLVSSSARSNPRGHEKGRGFGRMEGGD